MNLERLKLNWKQQNRGQSFVELALVFTVLMVLMAGMVEFGNLLNQYINLVDGAREGARFASNDDPFEAGNYEAFFGKVYETVQGRYEDGVQVSKGAINPIVLSKENHDDIVVTFFSVTTDPSTGVIKNIVRFQSAAGSRYNERTSKFTIPQIRAMIDGHAPNTGLLLVEVFYSYLQILRLFSFTGIPDPVEVHAYSIMPLSSAEPTPTPKPSP